MAKTYYATVYTSELVGGLFASREEADAASLAEAIDIVRKFFYPISDIPRACDDIKADPVDGKLWSAISWLHENRFEITRSARPSIAPDDFFKSLPITNATSDDDAVL